jgi:hypothetical protein
LKSYHSWVVECNWSTLVLSVIRVTVKGKGRLTTGARPSFGWLALAAAEFDRFHSHGRLPVLYDR